MCVNTLMTFGEKKTLKGARGKRIVTSTTLSIEDYQYCVNNNLMISKMLANAINVHRMAKEDGVNENYHSYLKRKAELVKERYDSATDFIKKKGMIDEFLKELNK